MAICSNYDDFYLGQTQDLKQRIRKHKSDISANFGDNTSAVSQICVGTILSDIPLLSQYRKIPSRIQRRGRIQRSVKWKYCGFHFVEVQLACII